MDAALSLRLQTMLERVVLEGTGRAAGAWLLAAGKTGPLSERSTAVSTTSTTWPGSPASCRCQTGVVVVVAVEQPTADFCRVGGSAGLCPHRRGGLPSRPATVGA
jgi:hypothetical protein